MNAYAPASGTTVLAVLAILSGTLVVGRLLSYGRVGALHWTLAWLVTSGGFVAAERVTDEAGPGFRMLAVCGVLLFGMKAVVTVASRAAGDRQPSGIAWYGFAALWFGMRPSVFARRRATSPREPLVHGLAGFAAGAALVGLAWWAAAETGFEDWSVRLVAVTLVLLVGLSLAFHFGLFNLVAAGWRRAGFHCPRLFRAPLASRSLSEFWSRRWNVAFSEMAALSVYRPLAPHVGPRIARTLAFLFSGFVHELAISVPVKAGYGLPTLFFLIHAAALTLEGRWERAGTPVSERGPWARAWVLGLLILPAPLLFHPPFLEGVIWPLVRR